MNKYGRSSKPLEKSRMNQDIHPVWRGVGCAFMVLIPIMSYLIGDSFLQENAMKGWIIFPQSLYLMDLPDPMLLIKVMTIVAIALVQYAILTMFSFLIFRLFAPPRYGPQDAPPLTYKGKQYKR